MLVVSTGVGAFFVAFGMLAIGGHVYETWGVAPSWKHEPTMLGEPLLVTDSLLLVSGGIATFTGLYFAIALVTDPTYREEFLNGVTDDLREVFAVRVEYLAVRAEQTYVSQSPSGPIAK